MRKTSKLLVLSLLLLVFATSVYAKDAEPFVKPKLGEVVVVGRLLFKNDIDREFYSKTFGCEDYANDPHAYLAPTKIKWSGLIKEKLEIESSYAYDMGDFFFLTTNIPKTNTIYIGNINAYYFGVKYTKKQLPINVAFEVNKQTKYTYIGTFVFDIVGDDFTIREVKWVDEYDLALEELSKHVKKPELERAQIKEYVPEEDEESDE